MSIDVVQYRKRKLYTKGTTTLQNVSMVVSISLPRILQSILLANDDDKGRGNGGGGDGFD